MRTEFRTSSRSFGDVKDDTPGHKRIITNGAPPPLDSKHFKVKPVLITTGFRGDKQKQRGYDIIPIETRSYKRNKAGQNKHYQQERRKEKAKENNVLKHHNGRHR